MQANKNDEEEGSRLAGFRARPEDYLEKIFQIPYWIRTMSVEQTQTLLDELVDISMTGTRDDVSDEELRIDRPEREFRINSYSPR